MVKCTIILENNDRGFYYAGESIQGSIEVFLDKPKKFRALSFVVYGVAECNYMKTKLNLLVIPETVTYIGKEVLLNFVYYLFGHAGADAIEVPIGNYRFSFMFQIPALVPASFEAKYGNIRYHVAAIFNVPWGFDKEFKVQFKVARNDDLNHQPELKLGSHNEEIKRFGCLWYESDPLIVTLNLPFIGFVPGQGIPYDIKYVNKSDVAVLSTKISLRRIIRYNSSLSRHKTKIEILNVTYNIESGVEVGKEKNLKGILTIPINDDVVNSNSSIVVQVSYEVCVEALTTDGLTNRLRTPIIIGTVPLIIDQNHSQTASSGIQQTPYIMNRNNVASNDPPSYEDAVIEIPTNNASKIQKSQSGVGRNIPGVHVPSGSAMVP